MRVSQQHIKQSSIAARPPALSLGPYHPALPGVMRLDLELSTVDRSLIGWELEIDSAEVELGYNHLGLEQLVEAEGKGIEWERALQLVERLCGPCSQANALAFVQAAESMAQLIVPPRAASLRLVLAEMERAGSHLMNAAAIMGALGMPEREAVLRDLRERTQQTTADWTGARFNHGTITYGGLARNIDDDGIRAFAVSVRHIERALRANVNSIVNSKEIAARLVGLGVIEAREAALSGLRGPTARAAGIAADIRADFQTGAYEEEGATIVTQRRGDAFSRLAVRLLEALESFRLVEQVLDDLPPGPVKAAGSGQMRGGSGIGRVEGPRGEVFCWVRGQTGSLTGLHISAGSLPTLGVLPGILPGNALEDLQLLLLSLDLCLPCAECG